MSSLCAAILSRGTTTQRSQARQCTPSGGALGGAESRDGCLSPDTRCRSPKLHKELSLLIPRWGLGHHMRRKDQVSVSINETIVRGLVRTRVLSDGKWFPAPLATDALVRIIAARPVSCRQVDYDRKNNRPVAQCYAGADDLQEQMVLAGWAWAYAPYSDRYVPEEKDAMARKVGGHAHRCHPPWEWRALKRGER